MPAIFPALLANVGGSFQCLHGGVFKGTASTTTTFDGVAVVSTAGGMTVITPCPGIAPTIPPCEFTSPCLSMATRVTVDDGVAKPVTVMTPQIAVTNGQPSFIPKDPSQGVKVL